MRSQGIAHRLIWGLALVLAAVMLTAGVALSQPERSGFHHPWKEQGGGGMM